MAESLIIVESPTKVKTIRRYVGPEFDVRASMGHIKDLPSNKLSIDLAHDFEPTYQVIDARKKIVSDLKKAAKPVKRIYLAPDPDREGEAIAWHIAQEVGKDKEIYRVLFNDLTEKTIRESLRNPMALDDNKYEAQQTRRILDRLVGYQISPLLWERVKRGLSAGRVQSVAVRIICDRETEIRNFQAEEYWVITAVLEPLSPEGGMHPAPASFEARLFRIDGKKASVADEGHAKTILEELQAASYAVQRVEKKEVKRTPPPPFTTSKLQQEASRWFRFPAKKTMRVAQALYEGVEIGAEGSVGLITYMRTDSVRTATEAIGEARDFIRQAYGDVFLPAKARIFKVSGSAQDAHEAIRPTSLDRPPQRVKPHLTPDQFRLYQLIWNRFVASQMNPAVLDQTIIDVSAGRFILRAQGSVMRFPGYTAVYTEGKEDNGDDKEFATQIPPLAEKDPLRLREIKSEQKFTQPPPRFTEASLVRELEEKGIGRPSTYASILSTIQDREYVRLEKGRFHPTELGGAVNDLLVKNFPRILDVAFTAGMEEKLDRIEEGKAGRVETLQEFYLPLADELKEAGKNMRNLKREETPTGESCEKCGHPMVVKWGRNGRFIACSNYPTCKNTRNVSPEAPGAKPETPQETDEVCPKCGRKMALKQGRFGRFLGCTGYPDCKQTMPLTLGIACPEEGCTGFLAEKRSRTGKVFYSCSRYPDCTFALWDRPIAEACPQCGAPFVVEKRPRNGSPYRSCIRKECGYRERASA